MIDIICAILIALAVWKGYSRGLIVAVFSFVAVVAGLAAAIKLSYVAAEWMRSNTNISGEWVPLLSFIVVMLIVILLVRWLANLVEAAFKVAMLGWINRLGGIILYVLLYMAIFSIVLFYATQMGILKNESIESSKTYSIIMPWGPKIMDAISAVIPLFKDMFSDLEDFFGNIGEKI